MKAYNLQFHEDATERACGVSGDTFDFREKFKQIGGIWNGQRKMWLFSKKKSNAVLFLIGKHTEKLQETAPVVAQKQSMGGAYNSPRHLAMEFFLNGGGLKPADVSRFTGLFGKDRHGKAFGEAERRSMIWMLNGSQRPVDVLSIELAQGHPFTPESIQDALLECITEYCGPGGKNRMKADCEKQADLTFEFPF